MFFGMFENFLKIIKHIRPLVESDQGQGYRLTLNFIYKPQYKLLERQLMFDTSLEDAIQHGYLISICIKQHIVMLE